MARTRRTISIDEKIAQAQEEMFRCKDRYDAAVAALAALQEKKQAMQKKELMAAIEKTDRSYEEIIAFLTGAATEEVA